MKIVIKYSDFDRRKQVIKFRDSEHCRKQYQRLLDSIKELIDPKTTAVFVSFPVHEDYAITIRVDNSIQSIELIK